MKSLKELMEVELRNLENTHGFNRLEDFITKDDVSAQFITSLTDGFRFENPNDEKNELFSIAQTRARHSAVSFLMGLVFKKFGNIMKLIAEAFPFESIKGEDNSDSLWMLTSLNHDRAYTSIRLKNDELRYEEVFSYLLLEENYNEEFLKTLDGFHERFLAALAYTYSEIREYDKYARDYHREQTKGRDEERIDHGILGGFILFDELVRRQKSKSKPNSLQLLQAKTCALTIAQHNIFKSCGSQQDKKYPLTLLKKLGHDSAFVIDESTPLLLLLSLVDTIECVKLFSKGTNEKEYLQTITVLESIKINVTVDRVDIDLSQLKERAEEKALSEKYERYLQNLKNFDKWTVFKCQGNNDILTITFKEITGIEEKAVS